MRGSIYKKIFFSFSVIIVLYTAIILFTVVGKEWTRQKYESIAEIEFYFEREVSMIDSKFDTALTATKMLSENEIIQQLVIRSDRDYSLYSEIFDQLKENLFSGYQLDYNIGLTKDDKSMVVGPNGYFLFQDYLDFIGLTDNLEEVEKIFQSEGLNSIAVFSLDEKVYLFRKIYLQEKQESVYFILNWEKSNLINLDAKYQAVHFLFIYDNHTFELEENRMEEYLPLESVQRNGIGYKKIGKETFFWKRSTSIPGLDYALLFSNQVVSKLPIDTIWFILKLLFVLLLLGLLLTIYFSKKNYGPYKKIITKIESDSDDSVDVESVLEKIENLQTRNYDLSQFKESSLSEIREVFLKRILLGEYSSKELERMLPIIGWEDLKLGGVIVILTIEGTAQVETRLSNKKISMARQKIIEYSISTEQENFYIQSISINKFVLISLTKNQDLIIEAITNLRQMLLKELSVSSRFVVSVPFTAVDSFSNTLREVVGLNAEKDFKSEEIMMHPSSFNPSTTYAYSIEAEQRLIHLIRNKEELEAKELIDKILRLNLFERELSTYVIDDFKKAITNTIKRVSQIAVSDYSAFYNENEYLFNQLIITDKQKLYDTYLVIFDKLFITLEQGKSESFELIDRVLEYIDLHFTEDISLNDLAEKFHLTESYLSKLIRETKGITFKNYLNQLKVNRAKELLQERQLKVSEVSEEVGCKNVNTFIRIFKQYEGTTPGKYQSCLEDEEM